MQIKKIKYMRRHFTIYSAFLDIKNSISWYQEMNYWYKEIYFDIKKYFLISRIRFLDIKNYFLISRIRFLDIKIWILDIKKSNSWYQKCISWYQEFDFLISRNNTHLLISGNRILDIKKCILDIKNRFLDTKKCIWRRRFTCTIY